jgi:aminoglycoside phosphotransferase (APT) family kinase protein
VAAKDTPVAEIDIDETLVRRLLAQQHPDLAQLTLAPLASGWDNAIYRLGDELTVRLPRRQLGAVLVEHEQRFLPRLAPALPLPVPVPVRVGRATPYYPWSWSVCPWFPGSIAAGSTIDDPHRAAVALGAFVAALHVPATPDAPANPFRGIPLDDRAERFAEDLVRLGTSVDAPALRSCWDELRATPRWSGPRLWLHGDLHAANVLVHRGRISAVLDFGDITAGDPACDLAIAWQLFAPAARASFRAAAGIDDDTWTRARGWALAFGVVYLANSADNPVFLRLGHRVLDAALHDT